MLLGLSSAVMPNADSLIVYSVEFGDGMWFWVHLESSWVVLFRHCCYPFSDARVHGRGLRTPAVALTLTPMCPVFQYE